jgi:translation initiation factor IF-1
MSKDNIATLIGEVVKIHANAQFGIKVDKIEKPLICYLAGKISKKSTKPTVGDKVELEVYPQDLTKGRIMRIIKS